MADKVDPIEAYLAELSRGLEVLGPRDAEDVVAEMREHLAEAIADAGGDTERALAEFGPASELVKRILDERGALEGDRLAPAAPRRMVRLSVAADLLLWAGGVVAVYVGIGQAVFGAVRLLIEGNANWGPSIEMLRAAFALDLAIALLVAVWLGRSITRARRTSHGTLGMRLFGLRRVHAGDKARLVRADDIPGMPRPGLVLPALVTGAALLGLALYGYAAAGSVNEGSNAEQGFAIAHSAQLTGDAVRIVTTMYHARFVGAQENPVEVPPQIEAEAEQGLADLEMRVETARAIGYSVERVALMEPVPGDWSGKALDSENSDFIVTVNEYRNTSLTEFVSYDWYLTRRAIPQGDDISEIVWTLVSVTPVGEVQ